MQKNGWTNHSFFLSNLVWFGLEKAFTYGFDLGCSHDLVLLKNELLFMRNTEYGYQAWLK